VDLGVPDVESECLFYDIFNTNAAAYLDMKTLSKQVPRKSSECDQDARIGYYRYENLGIAEKAIRNICFPLQKETAIDTYLPPDLASGQPMIIVDKDRYELYWVKEGEPEGDFLLWYVTI
jgi:hypothetical protein